MTIDIDKLRAELRAGLEGTTPGPWQVAGTRHSGDLKIGKNARLHMVGPDEDAVAAVFFDMQSGKGYADARNIALASHQNVAALLDHIDMLEAHVKRLNDGEPGAIAELKARAEAAEKERDEVEGRLDAARIDLITEQSERKAAEAELARLRKPVEDEVGEVIAIINRWADWIITASDDMEADDRGAGERKVHSERNRAADLIQRLAGQVAEVEREREAFSFGLGAAEDRLREAVEKMTEIMHADEVDDPNGEYCATDEKPLGVCGQIARAFLSTLKDQTNAME